MALMSCLALSPLMADRPEGCSTVKGWRWGLISTPWQTSVKRLAVRPHTLSCLILGKAPWGQLRECATVKADPESLQIDTMVTSLHSWEKILCHSTFTKKPHEISSNHWTTVRISSSLHHHYLCVSYTTALPFSTFLALLFTYSASAPPSSPCTWFPFTITSSPLKRWS